MIYGTLCTPPLAILLFTEPTGNARDSCSVAPLLYTHVILSKPKFKQEALGALFCHTPTLLWPGGGIKGGSNREIVERKEEGDWRRVVFFKGKKTRVKAGRR